MDGDRVLTSQVDLFVEGHPWIRVREPELGGSDVYHTAADTDLPRQARADTVLSELMVITLSSAHAYPIGRQRCVIEGDREVPPMG